MPTFQMKKTALLPLLVLLSPQFGVVNAFNQCYYPDGSIPTDFLWQACTDDEFSACCPDLEGYTCQPNGLCLYNNWDQVLRGACTDRTWNSTSCPQDICISGFEDTWDWVANCTNGDKSSYNCGEISGSDYHIAANCSTGFTAMTTFVSTVSKTSKPTRYTAPPSLDPALFSVVTSKYSAVVTASYQSITRTTTWESVFTSTISQTASITGSSTLSTGSALPADGGKGNTGTGTETPKKTGISSGVLGAVIAGPLVLIALAVGLFYFIRRKRAAKKDGSLRLNSSGEAYPPPNGPVGADQVTPYEVAASEAKPGAVSGIGNVTGGVGLGEKQGYNGGNPQIEGAQAYEMGVHNEKGWSGHHGVAEVGGEGASISRNGTPAISRNGTPAPGHSPSAFSPVSPFPQGSPAPTYSELNTPAVMPVELYGNDSYQDVRHAR